MKKRTILILTLLLVISLLVGALYKRTVTLHQLYPELTFDSCKNITAYYSVDKTGEDNRVEFLSDSKEFDLLMEQVMHQEFRKSFQNFLPTGTESHRWTEGDFKWELILEFDGPISMKDGSTASGTLIHITNFFGDLTIYSLSNEKSVRCYAKNQQQWAEEILLIITGES